MIFVIKVSKLAKLILLLPGRHTPQHRGHVSKKQWRRHRLRTFILIIANDKKIIYKIYI